MKSNDIPRVKKETASACEMWFRNCNQNAKNIKLKRNCPKIVGQEFKLKKFEFDEN